MYLYVIKKLFKIALVLLFISQHFWASSQTILIGNPLNKKRHVFHPGNSIHFKVKKSSITISGNIQHLFSEHLIINNSPVEYKSIRKLIFPNELKFLRIAGGTLIATTAVSFTISGLVRLTDGQSFSDKDQWILAGILSGIGVTLLPFKNRHYHLYGNRKIRYTDL